MEDVQPDEKIIEMCRERFRELSSYELVLPFARISAAEQLKHMPRTGKEVRLRKLCLPEIKARTVFDHTASLSYSAAALLPYEKDIDAEVLSSLIVYHDVNEILIGDVPEYTKELPAPAGWHRMKLAGKECRESAANRFLWLYGDENHRRAFGQLGCASREKDFLKILDLIDPIIAVWRYMRVYNRLLKDRAQQYIETMSDFFTYSALSEYSHSCPYEPLAAALKILCSREAAFRYLRNSDFTDLADDGKVRALLVFLVEKTPLFFIK